jgi:hypothetical protein
MELVARHQGLDILAAAPIFMRGFQKANAADDPKAYFAERIKDALRPSYDLGPSEIAEIEAFVAELFREGFLVETVPAGLP